jgi:hypothetical protein
LCPSPVAGSGAVELRVLIPLVFVANVIVAIVAWYAVGALLAGRQHVGDVIVTRQATMLKSWQRGEPLFLQDECSNQCQ